MNAHRGSIPPRPTCPRLSLLASFAAVLALVGCKQEAKPRQPMPRPVSVLELKETDPSRRLRLTGAVKAWKEEDISFEVNGRVEWTIDEGEEVQGRTQDENGNLLTEGTPLATLDTKRYEARVKSAEAQVRAIRAQAEAVKIDIEQVLPERLKSCQAELTRASKGYERVKGLVKREAATQAEMESTEAGFKSARANAHQLQATIVARQAELAGLEARAQEAEETVREARLDLRHCKLYSPFDGRVSKVRVIAGAFAEPGRGIVAVVVMDPIKVEVAVSSEIDRAVAVGDVIQVYPPGRDKPEEGWVYTKETAADPRTRTFNLSIMVRNWQIPVGVPEDADFGSLPTIKGLTRGYRLSTNKGAPLYVDTAAVAEDAQGYYLYQAVGVKYGEFSARSSPVMQVKRVRVQMGEKRVALLGMVLRELADPGGLTGTDMLALGAPDGLKDGDKVVYLRTRWMLRPGDVAALLLNAGKPCAGIYVPMAAIQPVDEHNGRVFVVKDSRAKRVAVKLLGHVGDQFRIEATNATDASLIAEGAQLINKGIHFLVPGEPVRVVKREREES